MHSGYCIPDGQDTACLGQTGFFLHTTNSLLEDRGDLGRCSFCVGSIATAEGVGDCRCCSLLLRQNSLAHFRWSTASLLIETAPSQHCQVFWTLRYCSWEHSCHFDAGYRPIDRSDDLVRGVNLPSLRDDWRPRGYAKSS